MTISLNTAADFDLQLKSEAGRRLASGRPIELRLRPGRYFVVVRARNGANGRYALRRVARTITHARTLVDGARAATVAPGRTVRLEVSVAPAVEGHATLMIERHDPLSGWLFHSTHRLTVRGGHATLAFRPPSVGPWRVTGAYLGTRHAAPSDGGTAIFKVAEPLTD